MKKHASGAVRARRSAKRMAVAGILALLSVMPAVAQSNTQSGSASTSASTSGPASPSFVSEPAPTQTLPRGFQDLLLGLSVDTVKQLLEKSPYFQYQGGPDVSLTPAGKQTIIETSGVSFIDSAVFQFNDGNLFTITIHLNQKKLDFYSMYTELTSKYGDPDSLSPSDVIWKNDQVVLSLEKPLTIKYIDAVVFEKLKEAGRAQQSLQDLTRDEFINLF